DGRAERGALGQRCGRRIGQGSGADGAEADQVGDYFFLFRGAGSTGTQTATSSSSSIGWPDRSARTWRRPVFPGSSGASRTWISPLITSGRLFHFPSFSSRSFAEAVLVLVPMS